VSNFREVTIGPCRLICADCMDVLPTLTGVDLLLTDPPYGISLDTDNSRFSGGTKGNMAKRGNGIGSACGAPIIGDDKPFDPSFLTQYGKRQIIWGWNNFPDKLPAGACLVWLKRFDEAFGSFLSDAETAFYSHGHGVYCRRDLSNNAIAKERVHPTQKPVGLMEWCLSFMPDAKTVLDPFMGSATTGVACIQTERQFIGIEKEEKYFDIACDRIQRAWDLKCSELPFDKPAPMKQRELLEPSNA
jgi:site-specific DNA-methyltransferase (adenine-specific)